MAGVKEGDFTLVSGNPGNTNRYRESYSASYNLRKGIPDQIDDLEAMLGLLRKYAAMKPEYQVALQSQIFSLANSLKYEQDVLAALKATDVVAERERREQDFKAFLDTRPDLKKQFGGVLDAQAAAWNKGDLDGFMAEYWNDDKLTFISGGDITFGWKATKERYVKRYQADGKEMGKLTFSELEVEVLGPYAALVRGRWQLELSKDKPGGLFTLLFKRLPEGWRIVHDHTSG